MLVLLPAIALQGATCEDPDCDAWHLQIHTAFLFWSLEIIL